MSRNPDITNLRFVDRPPPGWHVLAVMHAAARVRVHWTALLIDADPDDFIAGRVLNCREAWFRIPGKHKNREAAWDALADLMTTRH